MQVILTSPVRKLGKIGQEVGVKPGYARNYLIPKKLAIRVTENNRALIESQRHELEQKNNEIYAKAMEIADLLQGQELFFVKQAADDGRLYGSVSNKEIAKNLSEILQVKSSSAYRLSANQISLKIPLKTTGAWSFDVNLHADVHMTLNLSIGRTESEAKDLMRATKTNQKASEDTVLFG